METGQRGATQRDVRDLCDLYGVADEDEREQLMYLARQGKRPGWWQGYELDYFATYVGLEEEAVSIQEFQSSLVPGLLQTEEYARSMAQTLVPDGSPAVVAEVSVERVEEFVEVKMRRQNLLRKVPPVQFSVVIDEAVLHRPVGGLEGMAAQLDHLARTSELPNVTIQVIPYRAGGHAAMDSSFTTLKFMEGVPSVVYVEGLIGYVYLERPQDIMRYDRVFDYLRKIALTPQESIELISKVGADHRRGAADDTWAERNS